ncbi:MAG: tetratricopeptide repeat protein [Candidatus Hodarchaeales archaeon]
MTYISVFSDIETVIKKARLFYSKGSQDQAFSILDNFILNTADLEKEIAVKLEKARILVTGNRIFEAEVLMSKLNYQLSSNNIKNNLLLSKAKQISARIRTQINPPEYHEAIELVRDSLQILQLEKVTPRNQSLVNEIYSYSFYVTAGAHFRLGDYRAAEMFINLARDYLEKDDDPDITLMLLVQNVQALVAKYLGQPTKALDAYLDALDTVNRFLLIERLPILFNNIGRLFFSEGKFDQAHRWFKKAEIVSEDLNNSKTLATVFNNLGEISNLRGEYDTAYSYYFGSLALLMSLEHTYAETLYRMAMLERNFGHFSDSANLFERAIEERKKSTLRDLPQWYAHYARVLLRLDRISEAQECINIAYKILEQSSDRNPPPALPLTEGLIAQTLESAKEAQTYFLRGYGLAKEKGIHLDVCEGCLFIVQNFLVQYQLYGEEYQFNLAQKYLKEAHAYSKSSNLYPYQITTTILTGAFLSAEYNFGSAISILTTAIAEAKRLNFKRELDEALRLQQQIKQSIFKLRDIEYQEQDIEEDTDKEKRLSNLPYHTAGLVSALSRVLNISTGHNFSREDFMFVVFKFTDDGPQPFFMVPDVDDDYIFDFLLNFGVILNFLVGQGQNYFGGLYGPIPIQTKSSFASPKTIESLPSFAGKSSMIFASLVKDSTIDDARLEGRNYIIFTIVHPSTLDSTFVGREELKQCFEQFINLYPDVSEWTDQNLENLASDVIKTLLQTSL